MPIIAPTAAIAKLRDRNIKLNCMKFTFATTDFVRKTVIYFHLIYQLIEKYRSDKNVVANYVIEILI